MVTRSPMGSATGCSRSGVTTHPTTTEGTWSASGNHSRRAPLAHSDTYTSPSSWGMTSRSTCRIHR